MKTIKCSACDPVAFYGSVSKEDVEQLLSEMAVSIYIAYKTNHHVALAFSKEKGWHVFFNRDIMALDKRVGLLSHLEDETSAFGWDFAVIYSPDYDYGDLFPNVICETVGVFSVVKFNLLNLG